jgi:hypothetical protein
MSSISNMNGVIKLLEPYYPTLSTDVIPLSLDIKPLINKNLFWIVFVDYDKITHLPSTIRLLILSSFTRSLSPWYLLWLTKIERGYELIVHRCGHSYGILLWFCFFFFLTSTFLLHQHFEQVELSSQLCSSRSHSFQIILPTTGEKHTYKTKKAEIVFACQGFAR